MGTLISKIIPVVLQLLAGVGIGAAMDKVAADKLPAYPKEGVNPVSDGTAGGINLPKLGYFILAGVIGTLVFRFIAKKFRINF